MVFVKELFDQLEDLLEDYPPAQPADRQVSWDMKRHYLNMGQNAMWPRVHLVVQDVSTEMGDGYQEYIFPESVRGGRLVYVEVESEPASLVYSIVAQEDYNIIPGPGRADILKLALDAEGHNIRITTTMPLVPIVAVDDTAAASEEYSGPSYTVEGPVLYAMNRITARGLHQRLDYGRGSVNYQNRSAVPNELMASSIFWLDEFERRVDQWQLVHPQSVA